MNATRKQKGTNSSKSSTNNRRRHSRAQTGVMRKETPSGTKVKGRKDSPRRKPDTRSNKKHASRSKHTKRGTRGKHKSKQQTKDIKPRHKTKKIPDVRDNIRVIPLGGVEQIGQNMTVIEIGGDILVIDAGFQFTDEDIPGVDYILPNTRYLEERKDKIRAVAITHGHLDHIGGVPYIMDRIGNPPIYCRSFTKLMLQKRQEDFPDSGKLDIRVVETGDETTLGNMDVEFFGITHTIPDSMGIIIKTSHGNIVHQADFKLDHIDGKISQEEMDEYERVAREPVLLLMADSTNIENPGFSTPEWKVHEGLNEIIKDCKTRLVVTTFASQVERLIKLIHIAEAYDRKVVVEGRSMRTNIEIAKLANLLKVNKDTFIPAEEIDDYPPERIMILATGAQGEEYGALMRMANKTHKHIHLKKGDTVILSSSIVPGNERSVAKLKNHIARSGAHIITYRTTEVYVHGSGHGNREELKWLHETLKPKFFMPHHGEHYMLQMHAELAHDIGTPEKNTVVPDNGSIIEITNDGNEIHKRRFKAPSETVVVDGLSIGDIQDVVIRDRQLLAEDGIFVVIATVNPRTGKLRKSPDIISRGFVYLREEQKLLKEARDVVKKIINNAKARPMDFDYIKKEMATKLRKLLLQRTAKRPLVIPVILGV